MLTFLEKRRLINAAEKGYVDVVQSVIGNLSAPYDLRHLDITEHPLILACIHGHLGVIQYLLTCDELKDEIFLNMYNDYPFRIACEYGHLNVVEYLLTSPDLKEHADIHAKEDSGFTWACLNGHIDVVRYLLTSENLKEHASIYGTIKKLYEYNELQMMPLLMNHAQAYLPFVEEIPDIMQLAIENDNKEAVSAIMKHWIKYKIQHAYDHMMSVLSYYMEYGYLDDYIVLAANVPDCSMTSEIELNF